MSTFISEVYQNLY